MANVRGTTRVVVSAADARGAEGPEKGTAGDTLVPMLISVLALTLVGVVVALVATIF